MERQSQASNQMEARSAGSGLALMQLGCIRCRANTPSPIQIYDMQTCVSFVAPGMLQILGCAAAACLLL